MTGCVIYLGQHMFKNTGNLQTAIGLNVSEAECYAVVPGGCHGLGLQAFLADLGYRIRLEIASGSSSAKAFASRHGLGKQRHVQTRYLWLQERVALNNSLILKRRTGDNESDILTKFVSAKVLAKHFRSMGYIKVKRCRFH